MLPRKIGIDLGTANSLVYVANKGVLFSEPTVVAVGIDDREVMAVGNDAFEMLGKTPENIEALRPLKSGVIADYAVTEALVRHFLNKAIGRSRIIKPDVMLSVPAGATSVEARAILDASYSAGAKTSYLIPEPLAAAIGSGLPISEPTGNMIVNIGGGTTEIAIVSLYGMVVHGSVRVAGNNLDEAIAQYLRRKYGLLVGDTTAERVKISIGSAQPLSQDKSLEVKGRDSVSGLPKTINISANEIVDSLSNPLNQIALAVKNVLEKTPPELSSDIIDNGIVLSGGTSQLKNLDKFITKYTGVPTHVADQPMLCVVTGVGKALENMELFEKSLTKR